MGVWLYPRSFFVLTWGILTIFFAGLFVFFVWGFGYFILLVGVGG